MRRGREPARFLGTMSPDLNGLLKLLAKAGDPARVGSREHEPGGLSVLLGQNEDAEVGCRQAATR